MQTSICSVLRHRWRANCGFNPIQQQPPHHIAPNSELLIHLYHSSGLIQWKTGLSACLHLFTLLSLEATHHFHLSGNLNWFDIPTVLSLKSIYRNYYIYNTSTTFNFSVYTVHMWFMCSLASLTGSTHFRFVLINTLCIHIPYPTGETYILKDLDCPTGQRKDIGTQVN